MELWGHSADGFGRRHRLEDHLRGTQKRARRHADVFGAGGLAAYLGMVHDVGKSCCSWQDGLDRAEESGSRVGVPHKHAGTWLADKAGLDVFSGVVFGHHGGLPSTTDLRAALDEAVNELFSPVQEAVDRVAARIPEILESPGFPSWLEEAAAQDPLVVEVLVRMVFSAVVDADFLDTEEHFASQPRPAHPLSAHELVERFEEGMKNKLKGRRPSPVDAIRQRVYAQAVAAAEGPQGFYRLPAPTGSGKTFAAAGFALHHARKHELRRVIVAVPFTSITDQNAQEYRDVLERAGDEPVVLEHHSGVDLDGGDDRRWDKLAAENWDAPFVVTTTVRLFESLFDRRPAATRRLHNLARSVLVLDEVQSLPDEMLVPILSMLRTLTEHFGVTVLLASATQPTFFELSPLKDITAHDVIDDPAALYTELSRVDYEWWSDPAPTLQSVAERVAECPSVLVVCNTTAQAGDLHRLIQWERGSEAGPVLHLSTRMVARHRKATIEQITALNSARQPVAVVSTQLVEAGVDLDFPEVFRAFATAEAMQQAAGRCNRSGYLDKGRVVIFDLVDENGDVRTGGEFIYGAALGATRAYFGPDLALPDDLEALARYYPIRFSGKGVEQSGADIQKARSSYDFPKTASLFQMIKENTVPVVVPHHHACGEAEPRVRQVLNLLRQGVPAGGLLRELRPYIATLPKSAVRGQAAGLLAPVIGDLSEWLGDYDELRGIEFTDSQEYVF
ncbi:CRISPR-associated helicase Cas3' [Nocardiopsis coralliicola]